MTDISESTQQSRQSVGRQIVLPMALVVLLVVVCLAAVLLLPRRVQVGTVSDVMLTVLMLCPAVLCMLPLTIALVVAVFGMGRVHQRAASALHQVSGYAQTMTDKTEQVTTTVNRRAIDTSARFGLIYKWLGVFERTEGDSDEQ